MRKSISRRIASLGIILAGFLLLTGEIPGGCSAVCDFDSENIGLWDGSILNPVPNDYCLKVADNKCKINFKGNDLSISLKKQLTIGTSEDKTVAPMEINVGGPTVVVKPASDYEKTGAGPYCGILIKRSNVVIENFKFEGFDGKTTFVLCTWPMVKNVVFNKMDFSAVTGADLWISSGSEVTVKASKFNNEKQISYHITDENEGPKVNLIKNEPVDLCSKTKEYNDEYIKECVDGSCSSSQITVDGKCVCDIANGYSEAPVGSGICKKCEEGEKLNLATGACESPCSDDYATVNPDGTCGECKNGYARYDGLKADKAACVKCASPCKIQGNICVSVKEDFIVTINGECKAYAEKACGDDDADVNENGTCECKQCFDRVFDPNGQAYCQHIPDCETPKPDCSLPEFKLALDCNCSLETNAGASHCLAGKGDCNCQLGARPGSPLQVALPLIFTAVGLTAVVVWRRRSGA